MPGSAEIFTALFWSVLKGVSVSQNEVARELDILASRYTGAHPLLKIEFWMSAIKTDPDQLGESVLKSIPYSHFSDDFLQLPVLIMALADNIGNIDLWNHMCRYLPRYIPSVPWPFKVEVFDELDKYVQERVHSGITRESFKKDWRDSKTMVRGNVEDQYYLTLDEEFSNYSIQWDLLPENFTQKLAKILAAKFCETEDHMLNSWYLCDPISEDIAEVVTDIQYCEYGEITVERIMRYLNGQGYFNNSCPGYKLYSRFLHIRNYHFNPYP